MDADDPIEARNARLLALQQSDPVAWAICQGKRGAGTISTFLNMPQEQVEKELKRLRKAGEVKAIRYGRGWNHRPHSIELKRLARRAWKLNKEADN
jgi:DNA-binding transcriptional regulator LsrR (DeoR family)